MTDSVQASHILLMYAHSARSTASRSKDSARDEAARLHAEIATGGDFAALAREHSDCPSARSGGDLGRFGRGQMVGAFEDAAFGLAVGDTSDVIETEFGYHIVRRTG